MKLSRDQEQAVKGLRKFLKSDRKLFKLHGVAGSGKSSVVSHVLRGEEKVHYAAPTAKAAKVLIDKGVDAKTLHSLFLQPVEVLDEHTKKSKLVFKENPKSILWGGGIIVIDESSMVAGWLTERLMEYPVKVVAVGDPFQLPPVRSSGSLLTGKPDALLEQVHRQALDSPVLELATYVRERGHLPSVFERGQTAIVNDPRDRDMLSYDQVLVGTHKTRLNANAHLRKLKGRRSAMPEAGETVLAKKNILEKGIVNGGQYKVSRILDTPDDFVYAELVTDEGTVDTTAWKHGFTGSKGLEKLNDMGFKDRAENLELWHSESITGHASQGSQWPSVMVVDESKVFRSSAAKWLYTCITRAENDVTVVRR